MHLRLLHLDGVCQPGDDIDVLSVQVSSKAIAATRNTSVLRGLKIAKQLMHLLPSVSLGTMQEKQPSAKAIAFDFTKLWLLCCLKVWKSTCHQWTAPGGKAGQD